MGYYDFNQKNFNREYEFLKLPRGYGKAAYGKTIKHAIYTSEDGTNNDVMAFSTELNETVIARDDFTFSVVPTKHVLFTDKLAVNDEWYNLSYNCKCGKTVEESFKFRHRMDLETIDAVYEALKNLEEYGEDYKLIHHSKAGDVDVTQLVKMAFAL